MMNEWIDGCMNEWMDGCMNEWMDGCMNEWMDACMNEWMDGCMNKWMDGWMEERINERTDDVGVFSMGYVHLQSDLPVLWTWWWRWFVMFCHTKLNTIQ